MRVCHSLGDARGKICPVLPLYQDAPQSCVADNCMMWRWVRTRIPNPANPDGDWIISDDTHGFCGLAGGENR
jgi:hypothetical protein